MGRGRRGFSTLKKPKEKAEYRDATPEVLEMAARMIDEAHSGIAEAKIKYLFRTGKWEQRGRTIYGTAKKASMKEKFLTGFDFFITLNRDAWTIQKLEIKRAILDHELEHCCKDEDKDGNPKFYTQPHVVEDFPGIISRHGLWSTGLQRLVAAKKEYDEQLSLFPDKTGTDG